MSLALALTALGAKPGQAQAPTPCPTPSPAPQCGPQSTSPGPFIHINIVPEGDSCRFESADIPDVETFVGSGADWTFCSTCALDTLVEMNTGSPGPFNRFLTFTPLPQGDDKVHVSVPCFQQRSAWGTQATGGDPDHWKYDLKLTPGKPPLDHIDPRLEIDDHGFQRLLMRILLVIFGVLLGFAGARVLRR